MPGSTRADKHMGGGQGQGAERSVSGWELAMAFVRWAPFLLLVVPVVLLLAGCDRRPAPESYYPLAPGSTWKYVVSAQQAGKP